MLPQKETSFNPLKKSILSGQVCPFGKETAPQKYPMPKEPISQGTHFPGGPFPKETISQGKFISHSNISVASPVK